MKSQEFLGKTVRDARSGTVGTVIGFVTWDYGVPDTLVVQPAARADGSVPPTAYVPLGAAEEYIDTPLAFYNRQ